MHTPISGTKEAIETTTNCVRIVQLNLLYHHPTRPGNYLSINSGNRSGVFCIEIGSTLSPEMRAYVEMPVTISIGSAIFKEHPRAFLPTFIDHRRATWHAAC